MIDAATAELEALVGQRAACRLTGKSRATLHRHRHPQPPRQGPRRTVVHPAALTAAERAAVLAQLRSDRFVDKSPAQVWAILLDEGRYLCSISTMYRLLRAHGEVRERRRQATHPARTKPELVAHGPNQVWSWDATKLPGPTRGVYYVLLVMLDIFSRKAVHWTVIPRESQWIAKQFQLDRDRGERRGRAGLRPRRQRRPDDQQTGGRPIDRPAHHSVALAPARQQ